MKAHTVGRRQAWPGNTDYGQHTRSASSGMELHHRPWTAHTIGNVGCGLTSPPFDSTHGQTTSGVPCHHRPWTARMNGRCRVLHDITPLGHCTQSDDVVCGMTSPPLDDTHGLTTSGVTYYHRPWKAHTVGNIGHGMTLPPLDSTHGRQRRVWHDITTL